VSRTSTPFSVLRPLGASRFVLACDHATNYVPADLHGLGLPVPALAQHIAWDIGAAGVTEALSRLLGAPAVLAGVSRLVVDCNRQLSAPSLIPELSDGTHVPGNVNLSETARASRIDSWFHPYHDAIDALLVERQARGVEPALIAVHSMTPRLGGRSRPCRIALSSHLDRRLTDQVLATLRHQEDTEEGRAVGLGVVGDNEPYDVDPDVDYTTPFHAMRRGWPYLQVEFRQDEIADATGQHYWAVRLAQALRMATH
jgi:predicted N-formylglutamate amidohydrolase